MADGVGRRLQSRGCDVGFALDPTPHCCMYLDHHPFGMQQVLFGPLVFHYSPTSAHLSNAKLKGVLTLPAEEASTV